ncbi:hypothetical protein EJ110_NYTH21747 [Nymphaea thermarum]|nr:hypothetical protein EJ110_NYTH21747 [Nymphaea thermarum]
MANQQATPEGDSYSTVAASTKSGFDNMNLQFSGLDSSYKVCTAIKHIYAAQSRAKVQQLKSAPQNLKKGNESITTYFHKAKGVAHQLAMASKPVDEEDLVMNIIFGLPTDEYGTLKVSLRTRVEPINLKELYSLLLIQESEISKFENVEDPSAYVAHRQSFKNPNYRGRNEQQKGHSGIRPQDKNAMSGKRKEARDGLDLRWPFGPWTE